MLFWVASWVLCVFWKSSLCQMWVGEDYFSHSVVCLFCLVDCVFALQKLLSLGRSHLLSISVSVLLTLCWASGLLCKIYARVSPTFSLTGSVCFDLCWGISSISTYVLCKAKDMDLSPFFYMSTSSYPCMIFWRCFLFL